MFNKCHVTLFYRYIYLYTYFGMYPSYKLRTLQLISFLLAKKLINTLFIITSHIPGTCMFDSQKKTYERILQHISNQE